MRLLSLVFTGMFLAAPARAQVPASPASSPGDLSSKDPSAGETLDLPVSLDNIKHALQQPPPLVGLSLDERPTFRVQIQERQRIEELLSTLNFKTTPPPAGGLYMAEMQRQWWPSVNYPLNQPYAAFNQGELLTVLIENLAGRYLAGRAINTITSAERSAAEAAAREEVHQAVREYCAAQPGNGAGIQICSTPLR
jgi:hypothetical protein